MLRSLRKASILLRLETHPPGSHPVRHDEYQIRRCMGWEQTRKEGTMYRSRLMDGSLSLIIVMPLLASRRTNESGTGCMRYDPLSSNNGAKSCLSRHLMSYRSNYSSECNHEYRSGTINKTVNRNLPLIAESHYFCFPDSNSR